MKLVSIVVPGMRTAREVAALRIRTGDLDASWVGKESTQTVDHEPPAA